MSALTRGNVTAVTGTVGTLATTILAAPTFGGSRNFLQIQNLNSTNTITYTLDGTAPTPGTNGILLTGNGGSSTYDVFVPQGAIQVIASATGTAFMIYYA